MKQISKTAARFLTVMALLVGAARSLAAILYVDLNSTNATPPYTDWATAATNIQDAVDAAVAGDEIVVTNGIYATGGRNGNLVNVDRPLSVRSVNGADSTTIYGGFTIRCVFLTNGASLSGFTLTQGNPQGNGGAVLCAPTAVVSNCVLSSNVAHGHGGGSFGGTLNNCTLTYNRAVNRFPDVKSDGGGAYGSTLNNCTVLSNSAGGGGVGDGGGTYACKLNNCSLTGNSATSRGGGVAGWSALYNCTLTGNSAYYGGGFYSCELLNSISYGNTDTAVQGTNDDSSSILINCWTSDPLLADGWGRLAPNSPCINAGNNAFAPAGPDLDGNPRIIGGTVDIGAYEFRTPVSHISYAWLQQYGLPINAGIDTADPDRDAVDNYHEWLAGTNPTNALSSPAQLAITPSGVPPSAVIFMWSTNAVGFTLQSTTNPLSPAAWVTNSPAPVVISGRNTVTNPISGPQRFYRLIR